MNNKENYECLYEWLAGKKKKALCQSAACSMWMTLGINRYRMRTKMKGGQWKRGSGKKRLIFCLTVIWNNSSTVFRNHWQCNQLTCKIIWINVHWRVYETTHTINLFIICPCFNTHKGTCRPFFLVIFRILKSQGQWSYCTKSLISKANKSRIFLPVE